MDDNIDTITHVLKTEFPNRAIQHQFANDLHTFRLDGETAAHWLHVAGELIEQPDLVAVYIHHLLNLYSATDTLLASHEKWTTS